MNDTPTVTTGIVTAFALILLPTCLCHSRTWLVPSECPTVRAGLDSATYGDTVMLAPGTYYSDSTETEDQVWLRMKDGVALVSRKGAETTTLVKCPAALGREYTVLFDHVSGATLRGFTIRCPAVGECEWGSAWPYAVACYSADALIEDNIITGGFLNGISVRESGPVPHSPVIRNNVVTGCIEYGIECTNGSAYDTPRIEGNKITSNHIGLYIENAHPCVEQNIISHNYIGIVAECPAQVNFRMNVITYNTDCGAWIWEPADHWYTAPCFNCSWERETANDIYGNGSFDIYFRDDTGHDLVEATYNYWGTLCPSAPQFYGAVSWIPWVDSTHTVLCTDCGSCEHSTEPATWGVIKAMFR